MFRLIWMQSCAFPCAPTNKNILLSALCNHQPSLCERKKRISGFFFSQTLPEQKSYRQNLYSSFPNTIPLKKQAFLRARLRVNANLPVFEPFLFYKKKAANPLRQRNSSPYPIQQVLFHLLSVVDLSKSHTIFTHKY